MTYSFKNSFIRSEVALTQAGWGVGSRKRKVEWDTYSPNIHLLSLFLPHRTCSVQVSTTSHALGEVNPGSHWDYDECKPGITIPFPIIGLGRVM